jgi:anti-sigma-28 factor FlgM
MDPALRASVASGEYRVDPRAVADAMLARLSVVFEAKKAIDAATPRPQQDEAVSVDDAA